MIKLYAAIAVCVACFAAGGGVSWLIARGNTEKARRELAEYRADVAEKSSAAMAEANAMIVGLNTALTSAQLALQKSVEVNGVQLRALRKAQQEVSSNEKYSCRRIPLPIEYIKQLRRDATDNGS